MTSSDSKVLTTVLAGPQVIMYADVNMRSNNNDVIKLLAGTLHLELLGSARLRISACFLLFYLCWSGASARDYVCSVLSNTDWLLRIKPQPPLFININVVWCVRAYVCSFSLALSLPPLS